METTVFIFESASRRTWYIDHIKTEKREFYQVSLDEFRKKNTDTFGEALEYLFTTTQTKRAKAE